MQSARRFPLPLLLVEALLAGPASLTALDGVSAEEPVTGDFGTIDKEAARQRFGDTHLHTELSMDAGAFGNRLGMEEAYKFCRGETVTTSTGQQARLSRPLDFVVIADHSDGMGFFQMFQSGDPLRTGLPAHDGSSPFFFAALSRHARASSNA